MLCSENMINNNGLHGFFGVDCSHEKSAMGGKKFPERPKLPGQLGLSLVSLVFALSNRLGIGSSPEGFRK